MLQENSLTGLLLLIGLLISDWRYGAAALLGAASGIFCARIYHFGREETDAGLYGFSPALTGVVLVFIFKDTWLIWLMIVEGGILAAVLQRSFIFFKIPGYTFPFITVTWILIFAISQFSEITSSDIIQTSLIADKYGGYFVLTNGFGQVIFQKGLLIGFIFFIAVSIASPLSGIFGLLGSLLGALVALITEQPPEQILAGVFGFNAVLTGIALAGRRVVDALWAVAGMILTIAIHIVLIRLHILDKFGGVLTFPFVAGTWVILILKNIFTKSN